MAVVVAAAAALLGASAIFAPVLVLASGLTLGLHPGLRAHRGVASARAAQGDVQVVQPAESDEEAEVWREAYGLESERAELIEEQLRSELARLGEASAELREEFEGCLLDLDAAPTKPESEAANEWAEAYTSLRRCNEQLELRLIEMRSKLQERDDLERASLTPQVKMDFGPIRYQGITYKGISFPRFGTESGSSIFFLELKMPLGIRLEEATLQPKGSGAVRAVEVAEVISSGSAAKDGRVRAGDLVRAITVPQRRLQSNDELEGEAGGGADAMAVAFGAGAGSLTKALLVIPPESSFPFERVLDEIGKNSEIDSYVGMVFERPLS